MNINEFRDLTNDLVTVTMYNAIEQVYMESDLDKYAFCDAYTAPNSHIKHQCFRRLEDMVNTMHRDVDGFKRALEVERKQVKNLREQLNDVQAWEFTTETLEDMEHYSVLYHAENTVFLTDDQTKDYINQEFGFERDKVQIRRARPKYEVNCFGVLRQCGTYTAHPLMNSSDWNYIAFKCCGQEYIISDGTIKRV